MRITTRIIVTLQSATVLDAIKLGSGKGDVDNGNRNMKAKKTKTKTKNPDK